MAFIGDLIKTRRIPKVTSPKDSSEDEIPDSGMELRLTSQVEELPDHEDETEEVVEDLTWLIDREIRVMYELDNHPHIIRLEEVIVPTWLKKPNVIAQIDRYASSFLPAARGSDILNFLFQNARIL